MSDYSRDRYVHVKTEDRMPSLGVYEYASAIYDALRPSPPLEKTFEELYGNDINFMAQCVFVPAGVACENNWFYNRETNTFYPPLIINYNRSNEYLVGQIYLFNLISNESGTFSLTGIKTGNVSNSEIIDNNKIKIRPNEIGDSTVQIKFVSSVGQTKLMNIWLNTVNELSPIIEDEPLIIDL